MKKWTTVLLTILFFTTLFAQLTNNSNESEEKLREIVKALNDQFVNSIMKDDLDSYLSLYTDDAVVMLPFQPTLNGKNALIANWHNNMTKGENVESANVITLNIWSSDKFVYERGSYQITYNKHPNNIKSIYGSYFTVWKKQNDGSIKIKYDIANLDHGI